MFPRCSPPWEWEMVGQGERWVEPNRPPTSCLSSGPQGQTTKSMRKISAISQNEQQGGSRRRQRRLCFKSLKVPPLKRNSSRWHQKILPALGRRVPGYRCLPSAPETRRLEDQDARSTCGLQMWPESRSNWRTWASFLTVIYRGRRRERHKMAAVGAEGKRRQFSRDGARRLD